MEHKYLPSMSRPMEPAAALRAWSREVTQAAGRGSSQKKQRAGGKHIPAATHLPLQVLRGAEVQVLDGKCSQSFTGK